MDRKSQYFVKVVDVVRLLFIRNILWKIKSYNDVAAVAGILVVAINAATAVFVPVIMVLFIVTKDHYHEEKNCLCLGANDHNYKKSSCCLVL